MFVQALNKLASAMFVRLSRSRILLCLVKTPVSGWTLTKSQKERMLSKTLKKYLVAVFGIALYNVSESIYPLIG